MNLALVYSRTSDGIKAPQVTVEVHLSHGLPGFSIVGLPELAVKESKDRVRAAIINSNFEFPSKRITVNLAPADIPKDGGRFDLPIALGILAASGQIPEKPLSDYEFIGELSLSGQLRPVKGVLPTAYAVNKAQRSLILAQANAAEACLIKELSVYAANHLLQICSHLGETEKLIPYVVKNDSSSNAKYSVDLRDVKGQYQAKRALEIAAAGGHNLIMIGPPGTGKTMLASRLVTILPPMTENEALQSAAIASISDQGFNVAKWGLRPVRDPHHTSSGVALVGGGAKVRPGEISLAHNGVLFLDELTEFNSKVLDVLREPLETGKITISRAARQASYPAQFQLIAAMNPCPQGLACDFKSNCTCTLEQQRRYRSRLSAPFLDRIDLQINVLQLSREELQKPADGETSEQVKARVISARNMQLKRQQMANCKLGNNEIETYCKLSKADEDLLAMVMEKFRLSARAYHRILKVARTIADLSSSENIQSQHISEAISYRTMDRLNAAQN